LPPWLSGTLIRNGPAVFDHGGKSFRHWFDGQAMLTQAIRRAGRIPVPVPGPVVGPITGLFRSTRLLDFGPEQVRYLNFGRVVDTTRLKEVFGFTPRWTTRQAFDDYVHGRGLRPILDPDRLDAVERRIVDVLR
jgi:UDP-glucose 4-epimerase